MNLIERAHKNSKAKGFYEEDSPLQFPAKAALIATEIDESEEASLLSPGDFIEELADRVIRCFDLLGYLGLGDESTLDETSPFVDTSEDGLSLICYKRAAQAVRQHRNGSEILAASDLEDIVRHTARYVSAIYGSGVLRKAVEEKMSKNEGRPAMHNKPY